MTERTTLSDLRYARKALRAVIDETDDGEKYTDPRLLIIKRIALTALQETEEPTVSFNRAGGAAVCSECLSRYREHPLDRRQSALSDTGEPFLRVLCNGERVKL